MSDKKLTNVRFYKGERISELLNRIEFLKAVLDDNREGVATEADVHRLVEGEATLVIMKAKLTALQGE
jgi:nitrogen-specific signal transduction histidine kinase